jgi:hypothetical protein
VAEAQERGTWLLGEAEMGNLPSLSTSYHRATLGTSSMDSQGGDGGGVGGDCDDRVRAGSLGGLCLLPHSCWVTWGSGSASLNSFLS